MYLLSGQASQCVPLHVVRVYVKKMMSTKIRVLKVKNDIVSVEGDSVSKTTIPIKYENTNKY